MDRREAKTNLNSEFAQSLNPRPRADSSISRDDFPGHAATRSHPVISSKYFEVEQRDDYPAPKLCLLFRDGRRVYVPYAHLALIDFQPGEGLKITAHNLAVTICGRGLDKVMDYLYADRVRWIRESNSVMDDGSEDVFISSIGIEIL